MTIFRNIISRASSFHARLRIIQMEYLPGEKILFFKLLISSYILLVIRESGSVKMFLCQLLSDKTGVI